MNVIIYCMACHMHALNTSTLIIDAIWQAMPVIVHWGAPRTSFIISCLKYFKKSTSPPPPGSINYESGRIFWVYFQNYYIYYYANVPVLLGKILIRGIRPRPSPVRVCCGFRSRVYHLLELIIDVLYFLTKM